MARLKFKLTVFGHQLVTNKKSISKGKGCHTFGSPLLPFISPLTPLHLSSPRTETLCPPFLLTLPPTPCPYTPTLPLAPCPYTPPSLPLHPPSPVHYTPTLAHSPASVGFTENPISLEFPCKKHEFISWQTCTNIIICTAYTQHAQIICYQFMSFLESISVPK